MLSKSRNIKKEYENILRFIKCQKEKPVFKILWMKPFNALVAIDSSCFLASPSRSYSLPSLALTRLALSRLALSRLTLSLFHASPSHSFISPPSTFFLLWYSSQNTGPSCFRMWQKIMACLFNFQVAGNLQTCACLLFWKLSEWKPF